MSLIREKMRLQKVAKYLILLSITSVQPSQGSPADTIWTLYGKRDFFGLQHRIPAASNNETPRLQLVRAETYAAFGGYEESSAVLRRLLARVDTPELAQAAQKRLMQNDRALFRYTDAFADIQEIPRAPSSDLANTAMLLSALRNTPPEKFYGTPPLLSLTADRFGRISGAVNGVSTHFIFDTAATVSAISQTVAAKAGLHVIMRGYQILSSTGAATHVAVAVGTISLNPSARVVNTVFMVLPDNRLRFGGGISADVLIGFPVLSKLGMLRFEQDGRVVVGSSMSGKTDPVAVIGGQPVIQAACGSRRLFCRLDTASNRTIFFAKGPAFSELANKTAHTQGRTVRTIAGAEHLGVATLSPIHLRIGGRSVTLRSSMVVSRAETGQNYIDCSLGRDALRQLEPYALDLGNMRFAAE